MRVDQELRELVRNFESRGFKMNINEQGKTMGVRKGRMIKGQRADYSSSLFKKVGRYIVRNADCKIVDVAA